jgi:hypothetical protein
MSGSRVNPQGMLFLLDATQNLLNTDGWIQGKLHNDGQDGKPIGHCLVGALHEAARREVVWYQTTEATLLALGRELTHTIGNHGGIGQWNDAKTTTHQDVDNLIKATKKRVNFYAENNCI